MTIETIVNYLMRYGVIFIFIIVYLEQLNLPGLAAGVIMPAIGVFIATSHRSFIFILLITIAAGILGSLTLYLVGYFVGSSILEWFNKKFPKTQKYTDKILAYTEKYGKKAVFICRLIPAIRTIVSLISGTVREEITGFTIYSILGIAIWNLVLISSGYFTMITILK